MKEYPTTSRAFKLGTKNHTMMMLTLGLQSKIEDEHIPVSQKDVISECTDLSEEEVDGLHVDQFTALYKDIIELSYSGMESKEDGEDGDTKKL